MKKPHLLDCSNSEKIIKFVDKLKGKERMTPEKVAAEIERIKNKIDRAL